MKFKFITLLLFLIHSGLPIQALSAPKDIMNDVFDLNMQITTRLVDTLSTPPLPAVIYGDIINVMITFQNTTDEVLKNVEIKAYFPNREEKYTQFQWSNKTPSVLEPPGRKEALWNFNDLGAGVKDTLRYSLIIDRVPVDTIKLTLGVSAMATNMPVSEISGTVLYYSGPEERDDYPNLVIKKTTVRASRLFYPGESFEYHINYVNNADLAEFPASAPTITDTLPSEFEYIDSEFESHTSLDISYTEDNCTILQWTSTKEVEKNASEDIFYTVRTNYISRRDTTFENWAWIRSASAEKTTTDNQDHEVITLRPSIELSLHQPVPNFPEFVPDSSWTFSLGSVNSSSISLDSVHVSMKIDDGDPHDNIYEIRPEEISAGGELIGDTLIIWTIPTLGADYNNSAEQYFTVHFNRITTPELRTIAFAAAIDSVFQLDDKAYDDRWTFNNYVSWDVTVNSTADLAVAIEADTSRLISDKTVPVAITCMNNGGVPYDSVDVWVDFDDGIADQNIYKIQETDEGAVSPDSTGIHFRLPQFSPGNPQTFNFRFNFNHLKIDDIYEKYNFKITARIDTFEVNDSLMVDNQDSLTFSVDGRPDLAISIREAQGRTSAEPDSSLNFIINMQNLSSDISGTIHGWLSIEDFLNGENIYNLRGLYTDSTLHLNEDSTRITWTIPNGMPQNAEQSFSFELNFMSFNLYRDFDLRLEAGLDSVFYERDYVNNHAVFEGKLDGTPDLFVELQEINSQNFAYPESTMDFRLTCGNLSRRTIDSVTVKLAIDDAISDFHIYQIFNESGAINLDSTEIIWRVGPLKDSERKQFDFSMQMIEVDEYRDFPFTLTVSVDTLGDESTANNRTHFNSRLDGTPDLALTVNPSVTLTAPDSTVQVFITASNKSCPALDSIQVSVDIDDLLEGADIYSILLLSGIDSGIVNAENNRIEWQIPPLSTDGTHNLSFSLVFDKIPQENEYPVSIVGEIEKVEPNPDEQFDNTVPIAITVNAVIAIETEPINVIKPAEELGMTGDYEFCYTNTGNLKATDGEMVFQIPQFHRITYFEFEGMRHDVEASSEFSVDVGDIEPGRTYCLQIGLQVFQYRELPNEVTIQSSLNKEVETVLRYSSGEAQFSPLTIQAPIPNLVANIVFDKNIIRPDELPLKIRFLATDYGRTTVKIYNLAGEYIVTIFDDTVVKGELYRFEWYGRNQNDNQVASGVYFIHANSPFYNEVKKVILVR